MDYAKIFKDITIVLSVMDDETELYRKINFFYDNFEIYNYEISLYSLSELKNDNIDYFLKIISVNHPTLFPTSAKFMSLERLVNRIFNKSKFINFKQNNLFFKDIPVLLIAPGPSLEKNIRWIKENKDAFLIISVGAAVRKLYNSNIKPDIIISIDPNEIVANQFENMNINYLNDILFICTSNTDDKILSFFKNENIYFIQAIFELINQPSFGGKSVTDVSIMILMLLDIKVLYLLGLDLSIDTNTGYTHLKEHIHTKKLEKKTYELTNKDFSINNLKKIKGNFQSYVFTTRFFDSVRLLIEGHIQKYSSNETKVYNLSDGAFIKGTISLKQHEIRGLRRIDKNNKLKDFRSLLSLNEYSFSSSKILELGVLKKNILELGEKDFYNANEIMDSRIKITILYKESFKYQKIDLNLHFILTSFEEITNPYFYKAIFLCLENKISTRDLERLFKMLVKMMVSHIEEYERIIDKQFS